YSLTGLANSWTNLATLNSTASANGRTAMSTNLNVTWPTGANLYLLWADDNTSASGTDPGNQIDNFSLRVTRSVPPPFACALTAPASNSAYATGVPIQ